MNTTIEEVVITPHPQGYLEVCVSARVELRTARQKTPVTEHGSELAGLPPCLEVQILDSLAQTIRPDARSAE